MMSMPLSPPLIAAARVSNRKPLFGFTGPWQRMQEVSKIGLMSRAKSMWLVAGGGNLESSMASAAKRRREERKMKAQSRTKNLVGTARCAVRAAFGGATMHVKTVEMPVPSAERGR